MPNMRDAPTFNLKVVLQETGLKPDTIRAWERRYGLPVPQRSDGGHRLYSQNDIDTLKWLIARQDEGMSISRAVELWQQWRTEGRDPLASSAQSTFSAEPIPYPAGDAVNELRQAWIDACNTFDEQAAEQVLSHAFGLYPPEQAFIEVVQKGLAAIGESWYNGATTVQQEHFASALAIRRIQALIASTPSPTRWKRVLIACPPQEDHTFGLLLLNLLLRRRGISVLYLGANVPVGRMESTITTTRSNLVLLAAQRLPSAATLKDMAQTLHKQNIEVAYGGWIFNQIPEIRRKISGHFLGERIDQAVHTIEVLLANPGLPPAGEDVSENYANALEKFVSMQSTLEAAVIRATNKSAINYEELTHANLQLGQNIIGALKLGNMGFIDMDILWVRGALANQNVPRDSLVQYLTAYHQAAVQYLGEHDNPVRVWFDQHMPMLFS